MRIVRERATSTESSMQQMTIMGVFSTVARKFRNGSLMKFFVPLAKGVSDVQSNCERFAEADHYVHNPAMCPKVQKTSSTVVSRQRCENAEGCPEFESSNNGRKSNDSVLKKPELHPPLRTVRRGSIDRQSRRFVMRRLATKSSEIVTDPVFSSAPQLERTNSSLSKMRNVVNKVFKYYRAKDTPKHFMCRNSYRKNSTDSTESTSVSSVSTLQTSLDLREPVSPAPQLMSVDSSDVPGPATSTLNAPFSDSEPTLSFDFSTCNGFPSSPIFDHDVEEIAEDLHGIVNNFFVEDGTTPHVNNGYANANYMNYLDNNLVQTTDCTSSQDLYRINLFNQERPYSNLACNGGSGDRFFSSNACYENQFENTHGANTPRNRLCPMLQMPCLQSNPTPVKATPEAIFTMLEIVLGKVVLVQKSLRSLVSHFTHPSSELLAVQERKLMNIRCHIDDLLVVFEEFKMLLSRASQRLANMRYLLLPCSNSLSEMGEYFTEMQKDLIDSQLYFNESITLTLLKMFTVTQVLENVISRGMRSFLRSLQVTSSNPLYPAYVYDLRDQHKQYLKPFYELILRRMEAMEQIRILSGRVATAWKEANSWEEFLPTLYSFIGTIRALTPYLDSDTDDGYWSLANILPKTKLPGVLENYMSEFYRAMVTPSFARKNPEGFGSLFPSLQYSLANVVQQHVLILGDVWALLAN